MLVVKNSAAAVRGTALAISMVTTAGMNGVSMVATGVETSVTVTYWVVAGAAERGVRWTVTGVRVVRSSPR